ncbi:sigma-E factor regulatory protein RseB [Brenneria goodwinii]|uniref:Sigma factor RpoE negative regulatory protein RseB n=1 Tax=Brenneria goodwinii TaxID=1109412 RepID=A0A0G4JWS0_9GAMM|nr:sigma-E factor regulatory protein RseB [Brenneria goodwinii]ATA22943.1 anti-sigma E factor [Brenneria goodwinii]MCG8157117.1 sigma-E factor regulatory protein RseB [Brenneria goodwinii]MCG8160143.1 sigma-E factor regulatory protein RseB [Brenneria goodwinii]MCG8164666.1 sigma-E factor regulatory protein RseB [Brenneria goodwinii]MCG8170628.1 sigma-E factor regulatory protein RseB [Brenneria goodwinii]
MKHVWLTVCLLVGSLFYPIIAPAQTASGALLQEMNHASRSLNYEISFININRQGFESVRYRHALINNHSLAQLVFMDGPRREIVQRGNDISYFDAGLEPFTLSSDHIVDSLPALVYADYQSIAPYYDFIPADGRVRIADHLAVGIRIISRDATRYSYAVWMDTESKLPLRVDLQDRNGERLEQFLVTSLVVDDNVAKAMRPLENINLPPALPTPAPESANFSWSAEWLPTGMKEVSRSRRTLPGINLPIETRLYSDGLFSFSVNISPSSEARAEQSVRTGRRTIHTETRDNNEITVVGELPPATAKRVADNIMLKAQ